MTITNNSHVFWMQYALNLAKMAQNNGEVPVGAVLVKDNEILGEGWNQTVGSHDPTAHAEIIALRQAGERINNYRLTGTTLYVTLEPCVMCAGAIVHARIELLVFGAKDPRAGGAGSMVNIIKQPQLNHEVKCEEGVLSQLCGDVLRDFFIQKRLGKERL